jgi:uncharacterized cupredoxin-like copper-binding protein
MRYRSTLAAALLIALVLSSGCGASPGTAATGVPGDGTIVTTEKDFGIALEEASTPAGSTTFDITNDGPSTHEFAVIKTDLAEGALPVDGSTVTEGNLDLVDEAENVAPGVGTSLTVDLEPGSYVVICNVEGHYGAGMHAALTVT